MKNINGLNQLVSGLNLFPSLSPFEYPLGKQILILKLMYLLIIVILGFSKEGHFVLGTTSYGAIVRNTTPVRIYCIVPQYHH